MSRFHIFERSQGQLLTIGRQRYFIFKSSTGSEHMIPDKCPHRGGPLSRGKWNPLTHHLKCPWHNLSWPENILIKKQIPTIKINDKWIVYLGLTEYNTTCRVHNIPVANLNESA